MLEPRTEFEIQMGKGGDTAQWRASQELDYFKGHFPNNPILPAVAIIDVSIEILRRALGLERLFVDNIKSCKFMEPILPNAMIEIVFHEGPSKVWTFEWKVIEQAAVVARAVFQLPDHKHLEASLS